MGCVWEGLDVYVQRCVCVWGWGGEARGMHSVGEAKRVGGNARVQQLCKKGVGRKSKRINRDSLTEREYESKIGAEQI